MINLALPADYGRERFPSFTTSASGDIVYDGEVIGHLEKAGDYGLVNIRWNDGKTTLFDPWTAMWDNFMLIY